MIKNKDIIQSRQNKLLIWAASLGEKKYREENRMFSLDGIKLFYEAVLFGTEITHVFVMESMAAQLLPIVEEKLSEEKYKNTVLQLVSDACFEKITKEKSPQGIVTVMKYLDKIKNNIKIYKVNDYIYPSDKVIILNSLRDPSNVGAVLRSASAFGIECIIMSADCADVYQPKCVRAAMGALFRSRIIICDDIIKTVEKLRNAGRRVFAAELSSGAKSIDELDLMSTDVFMIGNEGHGIPKEVSNVCNGSIYLPIAQNTESLNAAVAASIFLWEMRNR